MKNDIYSLWVLKIMSGEDTFQHCPPPLRPTVKKRLYSRGYALTSDGKRLMKVSDFNAILARKGRVLNSSGEIIKMKGE